MTHLNQFVATLLLSTTLIPTFTTSQPPKMIEIKKILKEDEVNNRDKSLNEIVVQNALRQYKKQKEIFYKSNAPCLFNVYSFEELDLLFSIVEAEIANGDFKCKCNVTSVIFNRINNGWSDSTIVGVLTQRKQFSTYTSGIYEQVKVSESTIQACEYVFVNGDVTNGAMYFDSTKGKSWAHRNCEFLFKDRAGHWFYR